MTEKKVDIIGIGVRKAATSWLFDCLQSHPQVRSPFGPVKKELHFFNRKYNRGYVWYHSQFEFGAWKTCEFSPLYFSDKNVPERIHTYNPDAKLLLSLRNPIDRVVSEHRYQVMHDKVPRSLYNLEDALAQYPFYLELGKYASHLERFLEFFDRSSLYIVLFDDIRENPEKCFKEMYRFVGVDDGFSPPYAQKKTNVSRVYKKPKIEVFIKNTSTLLRKYLGTPLAEKIKAMHVHELVRQANAVKVEEQILPPLSAEMRKRLFDIFAEEIERLGGMIGRDLSHWGFSGK